MAIIRLSDPGNEKPYRRVQQVISTPSTGDWIILDSVNPGEEILIGVVIPVSGSGSMEFTGEDINSIIAGTASGVTWDFSTVSATKYGYFPAVITAVRFVNATGEIKGVISR